MTKSSRLKLTKRAKNKPVDWSKTVFYLGVLILLWGGFNYFFPTKTPNKNINTSVTQRNLAVEQALKNGDKTYRFETNFIPGIGIISDPEAYKENLEKEFADNK